MSQDERSGPLADEHTVIIAVSGGGGEGRHIAYGLDHARAIGAAVRIVHIVEMLVVPTGYGVGDVLPVSLAEHDPCSDIENLRGYIATELSRPLAANEAALSVLRGDGEESLVELSAGCACLVLGHHHINGFLHFFTHSVDERVINRARCPILIVPE